MVHASLRKIGAVLGRGEGVINALLESVGQEGTVAAYADFEEIGELRYFDPVRSPARTDYGIFPELLRNYKGSSRSLNPGASMVAVGSKAHWLCADHPLNYGYGPGSPLAKIYQSSGKILLLGSDFDHVTILHFAEDRADLPNKRIVHRTVPALMDGAVVELAVEEFDTSNLVCAGMPDRYFGNIVTEFIELGGASCGQIGGAQSFLIPVQRFVDFAVEKMEREFGR